MQYKRLHAAVWPEVLRLLREAGIRNYSIFQKDELLFGCFEYHGDDLEAAFERMNAEPIVKQWYAVCGPCQVPLATRKPGEWWADMVEVFHME